MTSPQVRPFQVTTKLLEDGSKAVTVSGWPNILECSNELLAHADPVIVRKQDGLWLFTVANGSARYRPIERWPRSTLLELIEGETTR